MTMPLLKRLSLIHILENEEKRRRQLQQRVMEQTDSLFRDFDKTARKGVLERLQKEERIPVERRRPPENNVISAHTKIWAAEEVENAMKRTEGAAAAEMCIRDRQRTPLPAGRKIYAADGGSRFLCPYI